MVDVVVRGGRVIDPETGFDGVADVAIDAGAITAVGPDLPDDGDATIDATGCIVAPGFIDLHSHAQNLPGHWLQALDGVTTTLELEAGVGDVAAALERRASWGMPLNHGFSASWAGARMQVLLGAPPALSIDHLGVNLGDPGWQREATPAEQDRILALLEDQLAAGALGVGFLLAYAPGTGPDEYRHVAALAAQAGRPTFTHARDLVEVRPDGVVDGAEEIVRAAGETGAHMHYCHINSTSTHHIERVHGLVARSVDEGARVTTEAYPYAAGATGIGASFLDPDLMRSRGQPASSVLIPATGETVADYARLAELRATEPGLQVIIKIVDDEVGLADGGFVRRALTFDGAVVASDAMPPVDRTGASLRTWPLPETASGHPRVAGSYARSLRLLVDEVGETWAEALTRCTLGPARILERACPAAARKGRLQVGCDADVTVFDPASLRDAATYFDPLRPSVGVRHVLVNGSPVVRDGVLDPDARPGRGLTAF